MQYILRIWRGIPGHQYWEEFALTAQPGSNIISALLEIQENPMTREGKNTTPVTWEQGCLEEVCGSCSMLINGKPRQACSALIKEFLKPSHEETVITLAPFTKFPLIRDLCVDRQSMFDALKKVRAWISIDGSSDRGQFGPPVSQEVQEALYTLSTCMSCGCCSESCPQVNEASSFMGPAPLSQVRLFNAHPTGKLEEAKRLRAVLGEDGIAGCGNAQNCVKVCPKNIPLTESIAVIGREATKQWVRDKMSVPDEDD